jgi:hypothetical protein
VNQKGCGTNLQLVVIQQLEQLKKVALTLEKPRKTFAKIAYF